MAEKDITDQKHSEKITFQSVQLLKSEKLGSGAYGVVCKAKCDELTCAAKILHNVFRAKESINQGRYQIDRFDKECQLLSQIHHPNIVQYLGTYRDPETNAPVLFLELMDESLTHFLMSSPGDIPYHIQVNLSYDIAQALAFLHANGIIHRDLSSNNVLLLAGRAKVTDFGMSRLIDPTAILTKCPGTTQYMPPEALDEPPKYTEKLDCFSFGVLIVQILTKEMPKPTDRHKKIEGKNPLDPSLSIRADIPEIKRRESHISQIGPSHPLLPFALDCLRDHDESRPNSKELCNKLSNLKEKIEYKNRDSMKDEIEKLRDELNTISVQLAETKEQIEINDHVLELQKRQKAQLEEDIRKLKGAQQIAQSLLPSNIHIEVFSDHEYSLCPPARVVSCAVMRHTHVYFKESTGNYVHEYNVPTQSWSILPEHPLRGGFSIVCVDDTLLTVRGEELFYYSSKVFEFRRMHWVEKLPPMNNGRKSPGVVHTQGHIIVVGGRTNNLTEVVDHFYGNEVEILNMITRQWCTTLPLCIPRHTELSLAVCTDRIYALLVDLDKTRQNSEESLLLSISVSALLNTKRVTESWKIHCPLSLQQSCIVSGGKQILAIGGKYKNKDTESNVYGYFPSEDSWRPVGRMSIPRSRCVAACIEDNKLLVIGKGMNRKNSGEFLSVKTLEQ